MAIGTKGINRISRATSGSQEALLRQLMEQYGAQATPKVSGLGRIMAPLTGIGSIIDAYYDARYQDKNASLGNVLKNYGGNLLQGVGTLLTGTNYEQDQKMQGASELLDKLSPGYKNSAIGGSAIGRMGVDILAGLVTDPTTYFGFGPTSLADDVIRGGLTKAGLGKKTVEKLMPQLAGGTLDDVARTLNAMGKVGKTTGAQVADNLYVYVMQNVGKSTAKSGALKLFGKTISESPTIVKGAKAIISPLGAGMDAISAGSKKFTPSLRENLLSVFDPIQGAIEGGRGDDAVKMLRFNREVSSLDRATLAQLRDAGLLETRDKMTQEELKGIPDAIEEARETLYKSGEAKILIKRKKEILDALKEQLGMEVKEIGEIFPEAQFGAKNVFDLKGVEGRYHGTPNSIEQLLNPGEDVYTTGNIYGQGFYTTDSVDIAKGYAKNRGGILGLLKQGDQVAQEDGVIYRVKELGKTNLFNMERPLTNKERKIVGDIVGGFTESEWPPKGASLRKVYDEIRDFDESADEIQNYFERIKQGLQDAGYDGLRHTGGKITGNKAHKVNIYWNPKEQVQLTDLIKGGKVSKVSGQLDLDDARFAALKDIDRTNMAAGNKMDVIYESLTQDQKELLDPLIQGVSGLDMEKKITNKRLSSLFDRTVGNYITKKGKPIFLKEGLTKNQQKFVSQYFDFERGITKEMEKLKIPTIDPRDMGYIARPPKGYKEKALKSVLGKNKMGASYEKVMSDKRVIKELGENGFVKKDTLQKVLSESEWASFKRYDPGTIGELIEGGGAAKDRIFKTRKQAEAAGIVFGDNPMLDIYDQTVRQKEQILATNFAKDLVDGGSFSKSMEGMKTTPVKIPGVGSYYTDKYTAKMVEDYTSQYLSEDGMNKLLTGFDKIQGTWKKFVTGMGPNVIPYNARNLIDDNIRVIVGGGDITKLPGDYELAMDLFKYEDLINKVGKKQALKEFDQTRAANFLKSLGVDAKNPIDELWNRSIKNGVYSDVSKSVVEMDIGRPREVTNAVGREGTPTKAERFKEGYEELATLKGKMQRREQATRMATYFNFWRKEGVESAGVDAVQRISFNYNELSKAEREVFKRVVPFYGFVKNNIRFYMDLMKDNPEKLSRYYNVYQGLQSGSQSKFGEDWEAMPDYVKDTLSIPFKKEGDELRYLSGINLGIEGLGDIPVDQPGLGRAAGNLSPILNMLMELTTGKDLFRNEDIMEVNQGYNYENRSELLKKLMNYQKYPVELDGGKSYEKQTVSPVARYALENVPFVSTLNTFGRRVANVTDKERALEGLTNMIFPGRINVGRVDDARSRIERKQEEDLYRLLQKKGIADVYKSFYIPEGLREQLLK
jgi:hypothetical protein